MLQGLNGDQETGCVLFWKILVEAQKIANSLNL